MFFKDDVLGSVTKIPSTTAQFDKNFSLPTYTFKSKALIRKFHKTLSLAYSTQPTVQQILGKSGASTTIANQSTHNIDLPSTT